MWASLAEPLRGLFLRMQKLEDCVKQTPPSADATPPQELRSNSHTGEACVCLGSLV